MIISSLQNIHCDAFGRICGTTARLNWNVNPRQSGNKDRFLCSIGGLDELAENGFRLVNSMTNRHIRANRFFVKPFFPQLVFAHNMPHLRGIVLIFTRHVV